MCTNRPEYDINRPGQEEGAGAEGRGWGRGWFQTFFRSLITDLEFHDKSVQHQT